MDNEKLIEDLRGLLKQYGEKIPYGELVGAPWPYSRSGDLVWQDPEPYFIEQAATALSTLQAENEKLRAELEQVKEDWSTAANGLMLMQKKLNKVYRMLYDPLIIVDGGHLRPVKNTSRQQVYKKLVDLQVEMGINRGFPWGEMRMEKKED